ncbi:MAG: response regulator transcription factor [Coriobacteriales bacterium]|jgi:DNA-binding response OmpR family regulator|nr:response regulator transcription factor [Coriobacteriales bacterium]
MAKILIVDDDEYIRELLRALLFAEGFETCEAKNGAVALEVMAEQNPDLAIVDVMMPQMDGFELCRHLRRYYEDLPVLMLTAKGELGNKVAGFTAGADDYLTKPFEGEELIVRVKALLRRYKIEKSQVVQVGKLTIDHLSHTVTLAGVTSDIPLREFELLFKLAGYPGRTFARDQLIEDVWGYDFDGNERTLDVHVSRLRERFPLEVSGFKLTSVRGLGYRLEVVEVAS